MKIQKVTGLLDSQRWVQTVHEKRDDSSGSSGGAPGGGTPGHRRGEGDDHSERNQSSADREAAPEASAAAVSGVEFGKKLDRALDGFRAEQAAFKNGLEASVAGTGPGLKVVLRDRAGNVVREMEGQEFLRLRDAGSGDSRGRGKILDQKL